MDAVFPGLRGMENLHPLFVHFPVVLLPLALLFQALGMARRREELQRAAAWLLYLGTLGALAAAGTGLLAAGKVEVPDAAIEVIELHEFLMLSTTGLAVALALVAGLGRRWIPQAVPKILLVGLLLLSGVLAVGADRGAQLVYQFGVSVQKSDAPAAPETEREPEGEQEHKR